MAYDIRFQGLQLSALSNYICVFRFILQVNPAPSIAENRWLQASKFEWTD